jgi:hypothetical protein
MLATAKLRIIQLNIGDRLKPVANINSYMLGQAYEQACAELIGESPVIGLDRRRKGSDLRHASGKRIGAKFAVNMRHADTAT